MYDPSVQRNPHAAFIEGDCATVEDGVQDGVVAKR